MYAFKISLLDVIVESLYLQNNLLLSCPLAKAQKAAKYAAMQALLGAGGYRGKHHTHCIVLE